MVKGEFRSAEARKRHLTAMSGLCPTTLTRPPAALYRSRERGTAALSPVEAESWRKRNRIIVCHKISLS
jgi:hypothetical protein